MRLDHWIKQLFVIPGAVFACVACSGINENKVLFFLSNNFLWNFILAFISTCLIASANYVINEWLDAKFDKYHPVKKNRSIVQKGADKRIVYLLYIVLAMLGLAVAYCISVPVFYTELSLLIMGFFYNVRPFRTKDIPYLDVLSESINNAIRLLIGWFVVAPSYFPPASLVLGYWLAGAFLMSTKRFSEYRMIGNHELASLYRKSFKYYNEESLFISSLFYAICSNFFIGIFLVKYRIELMLFMPFFIGMFCYYFSLAFKRESATQTPEKLYKEHWLMLYLLGLMGLFVALMLIDIPFLCQFVDNQLIKM
jgi:4-hydroxybenzoate polyprenyltransferase